MEKANFGQLVSFIFGIANDCLVYFIDYFVEQQKTFDDEFIYSHLKKDTDFVVVMANMSIPKNKVWVGTRVWRAGGEADSDTPAAQ